ncbi:MAG TPA: hypothetical protein DIV86_07465, partial [Alphaproteobacteria bacterium]|nr:hypothetical protein [Alphaproteobacteria bacterium]
MVGINSNLAAASATRNLGSANTIVQDSISRLSSGNRIVKASDDVAGLAIGTAIKSAVTTLQVALLNTQQANSVLSIADGALAQVSDILSRQKALATQANSGSLGTTERGYLNQEFVSLTAEIDRIVGSTSFNGITLLNGSIAGNATTTVAGPAATTTTTEEGAVPADVALGSTVSAYTAVGTYDYTGATILSDGDITVSLASFADTAFQGDLSGLTITAYGFDENGISPEDVIFETQINGDTYRTGVITAAGDGGNLAAQNLDFVKVGGGSTFRITLNGTITGAINTSGTAATFANELETAISSISVFQTRAVTGASGATIRSDDFDIATATTFGEIGTSTAGFTVTAGSGGGESTISVTINGRVFNVADPAAGGDDQFAAGSDTLILYGRDALGDLNNERLTIASGSLTGTFDLTDAGDVADLATALNEFFGIEITEASTSTVNAYSPVNAITGSNVTSIDVASFNDATYQSEGFGTFAVAQFQENGSNAENVTFTTTLGDKTYTASLVASGNGGAFSAQTITFTATDGSGSSFDVGIAASGTIGTINTSALADTVAENITAGLASVDIYSTRVLSSVNVSSITNTVLEGLGASSVTIKSNQFDTTNNDFGDVGSFSGVAGAGSLNTLSVVINGTTFNANDLGGDNDTLSSADTNITLIGRDAAGNATGEEIKISLTGLTGSIDLTNQDEIDSLVNALNDYFGVSGEAGSGGLSFQVGASITDKIAISINSVATTTIYKNDSNVYTALSIDTQENAQTAIGVLDNAISSVIARRADIGAAQSRFNFASNNIEISISNQDAARGSFLDADIANESTLFASAQVKLQASVSVLAQANALPRNL